MSVLVLGLGNDLLGDDGIGLHVALRARDQLAGEPRIVVRATSEMGLALLDEISGTEALVLVDSVQTGRAPPGHIHEFGPDDLGGVRSSSPHLLGIGDTLAMGRLLGLPMPRAVKVIAIEALNTTELGAALSPPVESALQPAADRVVSAARAFAHSAKNP